MQALAKVPGGRSVQLFHSTRIYDAHAISLMERGAKAANVGLTVLSDKRDGRRNTQRIAAQVRDWRDADIWFCGPAQFGQTLKRAFAAMGLAAGHFHQELFETR